MSQEDETQAEARSCASVSVIGRSAFNVLFDMTDRIPFLNFSLASWLFRAIRCLYTMYETIARKRTPPATPSPMPSALFELLFLAPTGTTRESWTAFDVVDVASVVLSELGSMYREQQASHGNPGKPWLQKRFSTLLKISNASGEFTQSIWISAHNTQCL